MAQKQNSEPNSIITISDDSEDDKIFPFTEYEAFESLMDMSRTQNRENYLERRKNLPIITATSHSDDDTQDFSKLWKGTKDKEKISANQTYHDFLLHKQYETTRERFNEIKQMGVVFPPEKFKQDSNEVCGKRNENKKEGVNLYDKTVDYLINENVSEDIVNIIKAGDIDVNTGAKKKPNKYEKLPNSCQKNPDDKTDFQPNIDYLVEDNYYPGLIDDAVRQVVDFNKIAFDVYFGVDNEPPDHPEIIPISLIEAFNIRFDREECAIRNAVKITPTLPEPFTVSNFLKNVKKNNTEKNIVNREEIVLANTIEVDIAEVIRNKPMNHLTRAITCLQRAEIMNYYDRSLQAAEEAFQKAPPDLAESAAVYKGDTFRTEQITEQELTIKDENYRPIEVVSYMGITKPVIDIPPCPTKL